MTTAQLAPTQVETLEAFVGLLADVDEDGDRETFYGRLAEAMCRLSEMSRAVVFRYDPAVRRVEAFGAHRIPLERFRGVRVTIDTADFARESLMEDRVLEQHPPFPGLPEPLEDVANEGPLVCVPMCAAGRMFGVVIGQRAPGSEPLSDALRDRLWTLGKVAALAATARIATFQQQRAHRLEERIDLAREIHDRVVQRLFGVSLALSATGHELSTAERERCAAEIHVALADLRDALQRPLGHEARETQSTLAAEIERLRADSPELEIRVNGDPALVPAALEPVAQAVFAEAIANARRHAHPRTIDVGVALSEGTFSLTVANDGVDRMPRRRGGMGMGLRLAAFSALQLGGIVEFGRQGERRWQVRLVVPDPVEA
jgi:signal transduction histidine kinase